MSPNSGKTKTGNICELLVFVDASQFL